MLFGAALSWALQLFPTSSDLGHQHPHHGHHHHEHDEHGGLVDRHLEDKIHKLRKDWEVPGLTVTVVASPNYTRHGLEGHGRKEWRTQYITSGIRAVDGDKVTPDTMWSIASNSKFFVSLSVGLLIHDGVTLSNGEKLSWNTKVKDVIAWTLIDKYVEEHLTLGDMLCESSWGEAEEAMQSGLPRHDLAAERDAEPEEMLAQMAHFRPSTGIREHWQYNNYHYQITPLIFPKLAGMRFVDFVQKRIWDPLGLTATYNLTAAIETGRLSESWMRRNGKADKCKVKGDKYPAECFGEIGGGGYWNEGYDDLGMAGAGGVTISGRDMGKWLREVLDPKVIPAEVLHGVLAARGVEALYPRWPEIGLGTYCLAQETYSYRGHQVYQHSGGLAGQLSYFMRIPDKGIGIFAEANDDALGATLSRAIAYTIFDHLLELPPINWPERYLQGSIEQAAESNADTPVPENPREASDIVGKYHNAAYGLLDIRPAKHDETHLSKGKSNVFIAEVHKFFGSHFIFTHVDGPIWQWRVVRAYKERVKGGDGDKYFMSGGEHGTCVFKENGIGFFADFWGQGTGLEVSKPDEERTEENAEVWFKRQ